MLESIAISPRPPDMVLRLPMKKKWFDMVLKGEKEEEYRLRKPYWERRLDNLICNSRKEFLKRCGLRKNVDNISNFPGYVPYGKLVIEFFNGYQKNAPMFRAACERWETRTKVLHPEWGEAEYEGKEHFVFHVGPLMERSGV